MHLLKRGRSTGKGFPHLPGWGSLVQVTVRPEGIVDMLAVPSVPMIGETPAFPLAGRG